jgi:hypothetical protein
MTSFKRMAAAIAAAVLLTLALTAVPAAAVPASCPTGYVCMYVNTGYSTDQGYEIYPVQPVGTCESVDPYRNALSSAWNRTSRDVRFYLNTTCTGTPGGSYYTLDSGAGNPKFSTHWGPNWDNAVDAIMWR